MDIERPFREEAISLLSPDCECLAEAKVMHQIHGVGIVDVLCRPRSAALSGLTFAVEVKSKTVIGDDYLGPWIKQAADRVHAAPANGWPIIVAGFLWLVGTTFEKGEAERIFGMIQLAQHFRVGVAESGRGKAPLVLKFGAGQVIYTHSYGGWTREAPQLLNARRATGGVRKGVTGRSN